ncbi:peptide ABC transporter substrate-binding protein [Pseudomonas taiwanensis]|uniref:FecR family protein n=1 Tax=Pseudomonas taiwanensis TaxID=470150 RepID=UPI0015BCDC98|nr:FecR family protein [Pseudomonas taiwanensis]NWL76996.1 peptide ABC transporter substrate-binding protein [Pseudomonas taiwanensis]
MKQADYADCKVRDEAAQWFSRNRDPEQGSDERREFEAWLAAAASHRSEYRLLEVMWSAVDLIPEQRLRELCTAEVLPLPVRSRRRFLQGALAAAASVALVMGATYLLDPLSLRGESFTTALGERRQVMLADGSTLDLNGRTRVTVVYSADRRLVRLEAGEAMFSVTPDKARPFVVEAGPGRVTVTGTRFNVRRDVEDVRVAVESGRVLVAGERGEASRPLLAGDGVRVAADGGVGPVQRIDIASITAWRQGKLIFNDVPLVEVAQEVSRYREQPLRVAEEVANLRFSSVFRADDTNALLTALPRILPVKVRTLPDGSSEIIPF